MESFDGIYGLADAAKGGLALLQGWVGVCVEGGCGFIHDATEEINLVGAFAFEVSRKAKQDFGLDGVEAVFDRVFVTGLGAAFAFCGGR